MMTYYKKSSNNEFTVGLLNMIGISDILKRKRGKQYIIKRRRGKKEIKSMGRSRTNFGFEEENVEFVH